MQEALQAHLSQPLKERTVAQNVITLLCFGNQNKGEKIGAFHNIWFNARREGPPGSFIQVYKIQLSHEREI